jgi:hypothetical protein
MIIERGSIALHVHTHLGGVSLQETHTEATEQGHILSGVALANATGVLIKRLRSQPMNPDRQ